MQRALFWADQAAKAGEVPVGAVLVGPKGQILAESGNRREELQDPTAHAELLVLKQAAEKLKSWRLIDTTLYVTLEPCAMCAGALVNARVNRLVFGALDPKGGGVKSVFEICQNSRLNHRVKIVSGILENECSRILKDFFSTRRRTKPSASGLTLHTNN